MFNNAGDIKSGKGSVASRLSIFDANAKTWAWVTGLPNHDEITAISEPFTQNGITYIAITSSSDTNPYIYKIDINTKVATKSVKVEADKVIGIGFITTQK